MYHKLNHCRLSELSHIIIFDLRYIRLCDLVIQREKMVELFTNSGDPDQAPQHAASDLDLHCSSITHLGISSPQWINDGVTR